MKPPLSNTELVQEIMDFSPHGALAQMFVMTALANYAGRVAAHPVPWESLRDHVATRVAWNNITRREHNKSSRLHFIQVYRILCKREQPALASQQSRCALARIENSTK